MEKTTIPTRLKVIPAFAAVYIIWGTTYLAIKIGIKEIPPFLMASFRYLAASVVLLVICLIKKIKPFEGNVFPNIVLGMLMLTLGQGILFWAELHLSSGLTAVLVSTLPICYILVDKKNWRSYFQSRLTIFGILLGLAGVILLFMDELTGDHPGTDHLSIIAALTVLISCISWAAGSIYYKNHSEPTRLLPDVAWQLLGGSIACLAVSMITGDNNGFVMENISAKAWGAVLYLAIPGSVIAFTCSYYLLSVRPPAVVGTYAYVNPIIAVILGVLVAGEKISLVQVGGIAIILLAAYLSNRVKLNTK
jgi:drug/metabolite transporter (DMT)-like permease